MTENNTVETTNITETTENTEPLEDETYEPNEFEMCFKSYVYAMRKQTPYVEAACDHWTNDELEKLLHYFNTAHGITEISYFLQRPETVVMRKIEGLDLYRRKDAYEVLHKSFSTPDPYHMNPDKKQV